MNKTILVLRYELLTTIRRPSFIFTTLGIPIITVIILLVVSNINRRAPNVLSSVVSGGTQVNTSLADGYIDPSGFIQAIPDSVPPGTLILMENEASAQTALEQGEIRGFYIISPDYVKTGQIVYVTPDFNPMTSFEKTGLMQWVLRTNLLSGDWQFANRVYNPLNLQVELLEPEERDENNPLTFILPYAVTILFYVIILMSATLMLNNLTKEKENRVLEILMSGCSARQLLTGKILGLGIAGLLQTALWVGIGFVSLRLSGNALAIPAEYQLPVSFLLWSLFYFVMGYAIYASLMAAVGALVPNLREASQATFVVILPLIAPMMFISVLIQDPNGTLAVVMSIFPLTSPVAMMTRLAATQVPAWQLALSAVLLVATAVFLLQAVASMFRAQTLLSGQPFNLKRFFYAFVGR